MRRSSWASPVPPLLRVSLCCPLSSSGQKDESNGPGSCEPECVHEAGLVGVWALRPAHCLQDVNKGVPLTILGFLTCKMVSLLSGP